MSEIKLTNQATPATPATGKTSIFVNTSKELSTVDDAGTVSSFKELSAAIHAATPKTTPVGADEIGLADSADGWDLKKSTVTQITATICPDASTTVKGKIEVAIASEVDTGTSASLAVSPDALAGSNFGERIVQFCLNGATALTTGNKAKFRVPSTMNGMDLVEVAANCGIDGSSGSSSSGAITITLQNATTSMLSTDITIDQDEYDTATAATPAVIDTAHDEIATGNVIYCEVSGAGVGVTYLIVVCVFRLP